MANNKGTIGAVETSRDTSFRGVDPTTGRLLDPPFPIATAADIDRACALADIAFDNFRETTPEARATFLETIADRIMAIGDPLIGRAMAESGLPRARLEGSAGVPRGSCGRSRNCCAMGAGPGW